MRVKKLCALLLIVAIMSAFHTASAFASEAEEVVVFSDFEECIDTIKEPWKSQGHTISAPVAQTERGKSAVLETLPSKMEEVYCDYPETDADVKAIVMQYGMKFCDRNVKRGLYTRNKSGEIGLFVIQENGTVTMGQTPVNGITLTHGVWYDMFVVYIPLTGEVRLTVNDGIDIKSAIGNCKKTSQTGLYRINFAAAANPNVGSMAYIDDVSVYTLDYVPDMTVGSSSEFHDFEDYTATDGATPPNGWRLQNLGNGSAKGVSIDSDDGKAIECSTNASSSFELVKWFGKAIAGEGSVEFDFKRTENSAVWLGLRPYDSNNKEITPTVFSVKVDNDGIVKSDGKTITTLEADKWYRMGYRFDTEKHIYNFFVSADGEEHSAESPLPDSNVKIAAFEFFTPPSIGKSTFVVDNVFIGGKEEFGVSSIVPNAQAISALCDKIEISVNGEASDALSDASFSLNGDSSYFGDYTIDGKKKKIILPLAKPLDYGKAYLFEATNLGSGEDKVSVIASFLTEKQFIYTNHSITCDSDDVTATVSAKASDGGTHKITLLLAIYNKDTGEMTNLAAVESTYGSEQSDLSVSLEPPSDDGSYEAYAYVWDGADTMQSLTAPKLINIE